MAKGKTRVEKDSIGKIRVPADSPWGAYTQRVLETYPQDGIPTVPELFLRTYVESKMIYSTVNSRFRKISTIHKRAIHTVAKSLLKMPSTDFMKFFPIGQIQSGGGTSTNMMVNEVLANLATVQLGGKYGKYLVDSHDDLNASQSSNDTFPGVMKLTALKQISVLIDELTILERTFRKLASRWKSVKKVGRTHLQDAVVVMVGDEFGAYARTIEKNKKYLQLAGKTLLEVNFGGTATGSLQNITPAIRKEIVREFTTFYKQPFVQPKSYFEQNSSSGDLAYCSQSLTHLANDLIKIGNDLRLLSSGPLAGFNELELPAVQPGSSIMPGKINPSVVEALTMVCTRVIGNDQTIQATTRLAQLELQQFVPGIARPLIESLERMTKSIHMFTNHCIEGIAINKKQIQQLLDGSFAYATDYSETLGYEVVAGAVEEALHSGKSLQSILAKKMAKKAPRKRRASR